MKTRVPKFNLQPTPTFIEGAPQREEYEEDSDFLADCLTYQWEWRQNYICEDENCRNRDCPQHHST